MFLPLLLLLALIPTTACAGHDHYGHRGYGHYYGHDHRHWNYGHRGHGHRSRYGHRGYGHGHGEHGHRPQFVVVVVKKGRY